MPGQRLQIGDVRIGIRDLRGRGVRTRFDPETLEQDRKTLKNIVQKFGGKLALNRSMIRGRDSSWGFGRFDRGSWILESQNRKRVRRRLPKNDCAGTIVPLGPCAIHRRSTARVWPILLSGRLGTIPGNSRRFRRSIPQSWKR